jgi:hypothetical protein
MIGDGKPPANWQERPDASLKGNALTETLRRLQDLKPAFDNRGLPTNRIPGKQPVQINIMIGDGKPPANLQEPLKTPLKNKPWVGNDSNDPMFGTNLDRTKVPPNSWQKPPQGPGYDPMNPPKWTDPALNRNFNIDWKSGGQRINGNGSVNNQRNVGGYDPMNPPKDWTDPSLNRNFNIR